MRQSREIGVANVEAFLSILANEPKVSASTHNQAHSNSLSAARLMRRALQIKVARSLKVVFLLVTECMQLGGTKIFIFCLVSFRAFLSF